jgi:hypothetical protein
MSSVEPLCSVRHANEMRLMGSWQKRRSACKSLNCRYEIRRSDLEALGVVDPRRGVAKRCRLGHQLAKLLGDLVDRPGLQLLGKLHEKPVEVHCRERGKISLLAEKECRRARDTFWDIHVPK